MANYSSIHAWKISWREEPGGLHRVTKSQTWLKPISIRQQKENLHLVVVTVHDLILYVIVNLKLVNWYFLLLPMIFFSFSFLRHRDLLSLFCGLVMFHSFTTLLTLAYQAPLSMEFFRQEYWNVLQFPLPGYLPDPGTQPMSPHLLQWQEIFSTTTSVIILIAC